MSAVTPSKLKSAIAALATIPALFSANVASAADASAPVQVAANVETSATNAPITLTRRECGTVFAAASLVIGVAMESDPIDPAFPDSMARFIAPNKPGPVYDLIVSGGLSALVKSKAPNDVAKFKELRPTVTCDGPKDIYLAGPNELAAFWTMDESLVAGGIDLKKAGIRPIIGGGKVASASEATIGRGPN